MAGQSWELWVHSIFDQQLSDLMAEVDRLKASKPHTFGSHPSALLLQCVRDAVIKHVPNNPLDREFQLGDELRAAGLKIDPRFRDSMGHWRRVKKRLPQRRRLFFWARSDKNRVVYVWLNDEDSLREEGSRSDVYRVFCELLRAGKVPNDFEELCAAARDLDEKKTA